MEKLSKSAAELYWSYCWRVFQAVAGGSVCSLGTALILRTDLGLAPWTILNQGISLQLGITMGQAGILFDAMLLTICLFFREYPGIGTCLNVLSYSVSLDFYQKFLPFSGPEGLVLRLGLFALGTLVYTFGACWYMSTCVGAGPKDSMMVVLLQRTPLDVAIVRMLMEGAAFLTGAVLGGSFGVGSFLAALLNGPVYRCWCVLFRFNPKIAHQENIVESVKRLMQSKNPGA